jgi:phage terminase Nu1 subunit (DNA packaging protein)
MATVTIAQLAKACNLTPQRIRQLVQEGMPRAGRGRYELGQCIGWYIRYLQSAVERRSGGPDRAAISEAQILKAVADAQMAQLKVARERGEMHHDSDAVAEVTRFCERVRALVLSIRSRYQSQILGLRTIPEAGQALDRIAADILTELQRDAGGTRDTSDLEPPTDTAAA